jgi:hypothetical protein
MKSKIRHVGMWLIAIQCGVWAALAPVIPALHQAFADHNHTFCLEHHRIEDAGPRRRGLAASQELPSVDAALTSTGGRTAVGVYSRSACIFSNFTAQATIKKTTLRPPLIPFEEREVNTATGVEILAIEIVFFKPKHSPPLQS